MAELLSEDRECPSSLIFGGGEFKELPGRGGELQQWQEISLKLISGKRTLETLIDEDVLICRNPSDEIKELVEKLSLLLDRKRDEALIEPSEPSFELSVTRTRREGIRVEVWLDAGNGTTGIYTWDAAGIRFYTTDEQLRSFVDQLKAEFLS